MEPGQRRRAAPVTTGGPSVVTARDRRGEVRVPGGPFLGRPGNQILVIDS